MARERMYELRGAALRGSAAVISCTIMKYVAPIAAAALAHAAWAAPRSCESLAELQLDHTTLTLAQPVAARGFTMPGRGGGAAATLPAFCRVAGTIRPSADSD